MISWVENPEARAEIRELITSTINALESEMDLMRDVAELLDQYERLEKIERAASKALLLARNFGTEDFKAAYAEWDAIR